MEAKKIFDKIKFAERLKTLMESHGDTTYSLSEYLGLSSSLITRYLNAEHMAKTPTIEKMATRYNVNPVWLMGANVTKHDISTKKRTKSIPVFDSFNYDNVINYEGVMSDEDINMAMISSDDSMSGSRIYKDDIVYFNDNKDFESGKLIVLWYEDKLIVRKLFDGGAKIYLTANNPQYPDIVLSKKEYKDSKILGEVIAVKFKV